MATIKRLEQKKGVSYKITVLLGRDSSGKQIRETTTFRPTQSASVSKQEKEANKFAVEFEEKVLNGKILSGDKIKLEEYCTTWLKESKERLAPGTYDYYEYFIKTSLVPILGYYKLSEIKPRHIKDFIHNLKGVNGQELKPSSVKKGLAIIKSIFKTAWRDEIISSNPAERVRPPKQTSETDDVKHFTLEETEIFLNLLNHDLVYDYRGHNRTHTNGQEYHVSDYIQNHSIPTQFRIFFSIAIFGGLRKGEILGLTWNDIDFNENTIHITKSVCYTNRKVIVKEPKTKKSKRIIRLPSSVIQMIKEYRKEWLRYKMLLGTAWEGEDDYLFIQSTGKLMHPSTPYHTFKKILKHYNETVIDDTKKLSDIPLHGLRHTSATLLISENVAIPTVTKRLGHANSSTTINIYSHALEKLDEVASEKLESMFFTKEA